MEIFVSIQDVIRRLKLDVNKFIGTSFKNGHSIYIKTYPTDQPSRIDVGFMISSYDMDYGEIIQVRFDEPNKRDLILIKEKTSYEKGESSESFKTSFDTLREDMKKFGFKLDWPFLEVSNEFDDNGGHIYATT